MVRIDYLLDFDYTLTDSYKSFNISVYYLIFSTNKLFVFSSSLLFTELFVSGFWIKFFNKLMYYSIFMVPIDRLHILHIGRKFSKFVNPP